MFTAALGEKVIYRPMTTDQMRASGQPRAVDVANMFQFYSTLGKISAWVRLARAVACTSCGVTLRSHWAQDVPVGCLH